MLAPPAYDGALIIHRSLEELASRADRIVVVDVRAVTARPDGGGVVTDVQFDVRATLKGTPARTLSLTLPGGDLIIDWRPGETIRMTGPATHVYSGEIDTGWLG